MIIKNKDITLRDMQETDIENYVRWFTTQTEWAKFDAPWEAEYSDEETERKHWTNHYSSRKYLDENTVRRRFEIEYSGRHIGWVCAYNIDGNYKWSSTQTDRLAVGIDICENDIWGKGIGTSALKAYTEYLFCNGYETLFTQTWSGNVKMIRCAEKLGFELCFRDTGSRTVDAHQYDGLTFILKRTKTN